MLFKNDIANLALSRLGQTLHIVDLDTDNTTAAKTIRRQFRTSLDEFLEAHAWGFAKRTAVLTVHSRDPAPGWRYAYYKPVNSLVIRALAPEGYFYDERNEELYPDQVYPFEEIVSGSQILIYTNVSNAHAQYTEKMAENSAFPNHFGRGFAAQLSMDIAPQIITQNFAKIENVLNSRAENDMSKAIADDISKTPAKNFAEPHLVRIRRE